MRFIWDIGLKIAGELSVILFFQYSEHFVLLGEWITVHSQMQTNNVTKDLPKFNALKQMTKG